MALSECRSRSAAVVAALAVLASPVPAQGGSGDTGADPEEVHDINSEPVAGVTPNGRYLLIAWRGDGTDPIPSLWATKATRKDTIALVSDGGPILNPRCFAPSPLLEDRVFFAGEQAGATRLWSVQQGTAPHRIHVGASIVADSGLAAVGDHVYFAADDADHGTELWRVNVNDEAVERVADLWPGGQPPRSSRPECLTASGNRLFFVATVNGDRELIVLESGGTPQPIDIDVTASSEPHDLVATAGGICCVAFDGSGDRVVVVEGSTEKTVIGSYDSPHLPTPANVGGGDRIFFVAHHGTGEELWVFDPTASPPTATQLTSSDVQPRAMVAFDGRLFFSGVSSGQRVLWASDGSPSGTTPAWPVPDAPTGVDVLVVVDDQLYMTTDSKQLWHYSSTDPLCHTFRGALSGQAALGRTLLLREDVNGRSWLWRHANEAGSTRPVMQSKGSDSSDFVPLGDVLVFAATGSDDHGSPLGRELWVTDGEGTGTHLLKDIATATQEDGISSDPTDLTRAGSRIFFVARQTEAHSTPGSPPEVTTTGRELWVTDGTAAGTRLVKDIAPGASSSAIAALTAIGSDVVFAADDGNGAQLWRSDGDDATKLEFAGQPLRDPLHLTAIDDGDRRYVFFTALYGLAPSGHSLFVTDGHQVVRVRRCVNDGDPAFARLPHSRWVIFSADGGVRGAEPNKVDLDAIRALLR